MEYRYKLTLEVSDHGDRVFSTEETCDSQEDLSKSIVYQIAAAIKATLKDPPDAMMLADAVEIHNGLISKISGLAKAYSEWDGSESFDECVRVIVDFDKLKHEASDTDDDIKSIMHFYGVELVNHETRQE